MKRLVRSCSLFQPLYYPIIHVSNFVLFNISVIFLLVTRRFLSFIALHGCVILDLNSDHLSPSVTGFKSFDDL